MRINLTFDQLPGIPLKKFGKKIRLESFTRFPTFCHSIIDLSQLEDPKMDSRGVIKRQIR